MMDFDFHADTSFDFNPSWANQREYTPEELAEIEEENGFWSDEDGGFPVYTEECNSCGNWVALYEYGAKAICLGCGKKFETEYCDHPEVPGGYTEVWIFQDENEGGEK